MNRDAKRWNSHVVREEAKKISRNDGPERDGHPRRAGQNLGSKQGVLECGVKKIQTVNTGALS